MAEAKAVAPATLVQITQVGELDLLEVTDIGEAQRTLEEESEDPMGSRVPTTFMGKDLHGDLPSRIGRNRSFQLRLGGDAHASFMADMEEVAFRAGQARITMMVKSPVVYRWTDPPTTGEKP